MDLSPWCAPAAAFTNVKRGDSLSLLHVSDPHKTNLPRNLQPNHLHHYYEDMIGAFRTPSTWVCRAKAEGQSTCEAVTSLADKSKADLLVLGSFGRKGEKIDVLGTVSDYSLREARASLCIVRSTSSAIDRRAKIVFASDGSYTAAFAFLYVTQLLRRPADQVDVVFVTSGEPSEELSATADEYRSFMAAHGVPGGVHMWRVEAGTPMPQGITEAARSLEANVLALGISGYGRKKLGSVSEVLCTMADVTTIVVKDPTDVVSDRFKRAGAATLAREVIAVPRNSVEIVREGPVPVA